MSLVSDYRNWRAYRRTVYELNGLSDKDLRDIGVTRAMIHVRARKACGL